VLLTEFRRDDLFPDVVTDTTPGAKEHDRLAAQLRMISLFGL
jgi:hypothetical protein